MALRLEDLPSDAARLTEMVLSLDAENERLRTIVATFKDMVFGSRSEKAAVVAADQFALDLADVVTDVTPTAANDDEAPSQPVILANKSHNKARRNIGALPKHLPRCEQLIEPETTICPCCQGNLHRIGQDVSEVLDLIPAILRVLRMIRPKYACRGCEDTVVQAKALPRLIENSMASTALVTHVVVSKFAWFSTLYRQSQILAGHGIRLDRSTLAGWVRRTAWWLKGLYDLQLQTIHAAPLVFCDETPMPVLDPGRGRTKICQFWAHAIDDRPWGGPSPPAVAYVFAPGRGKNEIAAQLNDFSGTLQVDGYQVYKSLAADKRPAGTIQLAFCLAHARRKFVTVYKETKSPFAHEVITRIAAIYAIEARVRGTSAEIRLAARQNETTRLMEDLKKRMTEVRDGISAQSSLAEAIRYALHHWDGLTLFLSDGRVEVDFEHGGAFDAPDCSWKTQFIVLRQRRRRRELGYPGIASQHGKAQRCRSADLSVRRPRTHRLGSHQEPPVARAIGLELEGRPHDACSGRRMSTQRRSKPSPTKHPPMTAVAMPLNELDLWLQARVGQGAPATDLSMLDGFVAAIVAGPVSMDPRDWICPLLGVAREAFVHGGTAEFAAISAVAVRHNVIANTLSTAPRDFVPIFERKPNGDIDAGSWCSGFYAAIQLKPSAWAPLLTKDGIESGLLLPILFHCVDRNGHPLIPSAPIGAKVDMLRRSAHTAIPAAVELTRQYWMPTRFKTRP